MRPVGAEERAALGRCLGAGVTPVQGLRRIPGAGREVRHSEAGQRIAAGSGHGLRSVFARPAGIAGTATRHRQPHGGGKRPAGCHHYRVRPEDHAAGRGGAGDRASPDRPVGDAATARQDHRTADGG